VSKLLKFEFNTKKRNPIYIIILLIIILLNIVLAFAYSPTQPNNKTSLDMQDYTIEELNSIYSDNILPQLNNRTDMSLSVISYYNLIKEREEKINTLYDKILVDFNNLETIKYGGNTALINEKANLLKDSLEQFNEQLTNFNGMYDIQYVQLLKNQSEYMQNIEFGKINQTLATITSYINNGGNDYGNRIYTLLNSETFTKTLQNCKNISLNFLQYTLNQKYDEILNSFNNYQNYVTSTATQFFNSYEANNKLSNFYNKLNSYNIMLNAIINSEFNIVVVKNELKDNVAKFVSQVLEISNTYTTSRSEHRTIIAEIKETNFLNHIESFDNNFKIVSITTERLHELNDYVDKLSENTQINNELIESAYSNKNSKSMKELITKQSVLSDSIINLINNTLTIQCSNEYDIYQKYLDDNQIYESQCQVTLSKYYITNNTYPTDIINNYQFNYQVNDSITAYDYVVFAMKITSIIITIVSAILICYSISGGNRNGRLRYILMSPNSRQSIYFAKYFTTLSLIVLTLIISTITSGFVGIIMFGEEVGNIITVFNATTIITIQPIVAILINLICNIIEVVAYATIIYLISIACKSLSITITTSIITLLGCGLLSKIVSPIMAIFPSNNFNLNKYFYATTYTSDNILHRLFDYTSYSSQSFYLSLIITLLTIIIINIINVTVFKKKSY